MFQDYFTITPTGLIKKSPNVDAEVVSQIVLNVTVNDINTHSDYESSSSGMSPLRGYCFQTLIKIEIVEFKKGWWVVDRGTMQMISIIFLSSHKNDFINLNT